LAAQLLLDAALPWSPRTHALFPPAARARVVELLRIGVQLSRASESSAEQWLPQIPAELWLSIISLAVTRGAFLPPAAHGRALASRPQGARARGADQGRGLPAVLAARRRRKFSRRARTARSSYP
jgi:hypothetical protein